MYIHHEALCLTIENYSQPILCFWAQHNKAQSTPILDRNNFSGMSATPANKRSIYVSLHLNHYHDNSSLLS